jgi:hypothetical protein
MSMVALTLDILDKIIKSLERSGCESRRIVSLGYPDILASPEQVRAIFGDAIFSRLAFRADSASIVGYHGVQGITDRVIEAGSLFDALGFPLDVIDIHAARGGEIVHDLNLPVARALHERYAVVLDAGTIEHCFNIAQAIANAASLAARGGVILHGNPINMYNHGFYNLNPNWYHDFYAANGFHVDYLRLVLDVLSPAPKLFELPAFERFASVPENATLLVVARRLAVQEIRWPVQRKYRENPMLGG